MGSQAHHSLVVPECQFLTPRAVQAKAVGTAQLAWARVPFWEGNLKLEQTSISVRLGIHGEKQRLPDQPPAPSGWQLVATATFERPPPSPNGGLKLAGEYLQGGGGLAAQLLIRVLGTDTYA